MNRDITWDRVRELFDYKKSGKLIRRVTVANAKKGTEAACDGPDGYLVAQVDGSSYRVHRLVYLWHHGYMPEGYIDHIDHNPRNNRIENLREVTQSCNLMNSKINKRNKSGVRGVHYDDVSKNWKAQIRVRGKAYALGGYDDFRDAVMARFISELKNDWGGCNNSSSAGDFLVKTLGVVPMAKAIHDILTAKQDRN